jgi:hypothetical protein
MVKMLKYLDTMLGADEMWDRICIVATHFSSDTTREDREAFTSVTLGMSVIRDEISALLRKLHNGSRDDPELPVFFVNSRKPHGITEDDFRRFLRWAGSRAGGGIAPGRVTEPDLNVMWRMKQVMGTTAVEKSKLIMRPIQKNNNSEPLKVGNQVKDERRRAKTGVAVFDKVVSWTTGTMAALLPKQRDESMMQNDITSQGVEIRRGTDIEKVNLEPGMELVKYSQMWRATRERNVTWSYDADVPIDDNIDATKSVTGRTIGPWVVVEEPDGEEIEDILKRN